MCARTDFTVVGYFEFVQPFVCFQMCHTDFMPKRISTSHTQDVNQAAFQMVHRLTGTDNPSPVPAKVTNSDISRVMAAMGRRGGQIGGKRRLTTMTPEQRQETARKAAQARWAKEPK
jgi:hypothetical protein